ncbi:protein phosphatase regulator [Ascochyta lentis]
MTRPQIIRADTIDLQDKSSPTAQDHSNQPEHPAPLGIGPAAPHQQASLQSVEDERNAEESRLQTAWSHAGTSLREDPGSDDERTTMNHAHDQKPQQHENDNDHDHDHDHDHDDDDMQDADVEEDMDDDMLDKISSSPSIDDEDIDFEFVYALHTFVATVEGQANATKGDTMVLLDDSNSYWWLVRVVKDSSIGYLPAEHIETPTERLARLNKHRNIDLSATMLGDTAEKTKNPLKKAMRRRNAKTVQFGAPTYVEASDYDYSSDEEGGELFGGPEPKQAQQQQQQQDAAQKSEVEQEDAMQVQPLKLGGGVKKVSSEESRTSSEEAAADDDKSRASDEIFDRPLDQKVSRNGTLRNTDSFFKDENTETRKITLTPNLLRDDSSTSTTGSRERGPSLESLEKNGFADKVKDEKKKKDKKSGMLSGLFKRKDKKDKDSKGDIDTVEADLKKAIEKPEQTSPQITPAKPAEVSPERPSEEQVGPTPSRQSSKGKLQKQQRARTDSPIKTKSILKTDSPMEATVDPEEAIGAGENKQQTASTMRIVSPDQDEPAVQERVKSPESQSVMAAISSKNPFRSNTASDGTPKPEKVHKAKARVQLDDFDSSEEESDDPFADPDAQEKPVEQTATEPVGRLSESPVHVSAADAQPTVKEVAPVRHLESDAQQPPGLTGDNSSADTSSRVSTPDLDDATPDTIVPDKLNAAPRSGTSPSPTHLSPNTHTNTIPPPSRAAPVPLNLNTSPTASSAPVSSESSTLPAWSDASLRSYLDDGSEIRDLLLMINDTTGVFPVSKDHPLMSGLFVEESKAAQSLSCELDRLLTGLVDNRMRRNGSAASKKSGVSMASRASSSVR